MTYEALKDLGVTRAAMVAAMANMKHPDSYRSSLVSDCVAAGDASILDEIFL